MKTHDKEKRASILILNWNGINFLKDNLDSIRKQEYDNFDILIIDNGSTDGSIKYIKELSKKDKRVRILENEKNLGFAEGNNRGIQKILREGKSEYIVLLNNDIKAPSNWLENLMSGFTDDKTGICTSKILFYYPYQQIVIIPNQSILLKSLNIDCLDYHTLLFRDGFDKKGERIDFPFTLKEGQIYNFAVPYSNGNKKMNGKLRIDIDSGRLKTFIGEDKYELEKGEFEIKLAGLYIIQNAGTEFIEENMTFSDNLIFEFDQELNTKTVDAGCGCAMAIRADLLKKLGDLKEKYFMYNEDTELCFRYSREGFLTKFVSNAVCYHYFWGSSEGKVQERQTFYGTRNRLWFIKTYFGKIKFAYFYLRTAIRTLIWGIKSIFDKKRAGMYFNSYKKALHEALTLDP